MRPEEYASEISLARERISRCRAPHLVGIHRRLGRERLELAADESR
jgi:hypothetical protein